MTGLKTINGGCPVWEADAGELRDGTGGCIGSFKRGDEELKPVFLKYHLVLQGSTLPKKNQNLSLLLPSARRL